MSGSEQKERSSSPRIYKIAIMILPIGVVIGTAVFMWMYYAKHQDKQQEQSVISAPGIRMADLEDMMGKLTGLIGIRNVELEQGRIGLRRAAVMIDGGLGPQNVGFQVKRGPGESAHGRLWKSIWVDVRGVEAPEEVLIAAVPYAGKGQDADAGVVSMLMMVASSMAREETRRTVRFVFLPFEMSPDEQNRWLRDRCLAEGESLVGVVGITATEAAGNFPDQGWVMIKDPGTIDHPWWTHLRGEGGLPSESGGRSVWLTHRVFLYGDGRENALERKQGILRVAEQLRGWLIHVAG